MEYRVRDLEQHTWDDGDELEDPHAAELMDDKAYEDCFSEASKYESWMTQEAFLNEVSRDLCDVHSGRNPLRQYDILFETDEKLDEDQFITDVRDAIRYHNNPEGMLKIDPRARRARNEKIAGIFGTGGSWMGGILKHYVADGVNYATETVSMHTGDALAASTSPEEVGTVMAGTAAISLGAVIHGEYKMLHMKSYEIGMNIQDKLSVEPVDAEDMEDTDHAYQLTYRVRSPDTYAELAKTDAAYLANTPEIMKSVFWDSFTWLGETTVNTTKRALPYTSEQPEPPEDNPDHPTN